MANPDPSPAMQPVTRCPSCGHTRGSDHDCDNVFHELFPNCGGGVSGNNSRMALVRSMELTPEQRKIFEESQAQWDKAAKPYIEALERSEMLGDTSIRMNTKGPLPDSSPATQPVTRCPQCGHTRGSDHACDNVFHASPAMQEERIETLVDELVRWAKVANDARGAQLVHPDRGYGPTIRKAEREIVATRTALLTRYQELEQEVEILRNQLYDRNASISSLKASQITPEEARAQIEGMHHLPDPRYHTWLMGRNKLRDIAGMGPQPHEVPPHTPG